MSELYSEFLVKKESTFKDAMIKYGLIALTVVAVAAGLFVSPLIFLVAIGLGIACYFIIPKTDLEYEYLFVNGELDIDMIMSKSKRKRVKSLNITEADLVAPLNSHRMDYYNGNQKMKITSVECYKGAFITVKVNTDEGISGFGEAGLSYGSCQNAAWGNCQDFAKMVIGMDPFDTEKIYEHLHRHTFWGMNGGVTVSAAMAAIDIACWDIKGKALGLPVYKLLGGKTHDSLRAYASQLQMGWRTLITKLDRSELQFEPKDYYDAVRMPWRTDTMQLRLTRALPDYQERILTRRT